MPEQPEIMECNMQKASNVVFWDSVTSFGECIRNHVSTGRKDTGRHLYLCCQKI